MRRVTVAIWRGRMAATGPPSGWIAGAFWLVLFFGLTDRSVPVFFADRYAGRMSAERRQVLRRKYLSLGLGELVAAAVFAVVAAVLIAPRLTAGSDAAALWAALIPLLVILVQAGAYWLAARSWVELRPMPAAWARTYRLFRGADAAVLALGLLGVIAWWPGSVGTALLVLAVWTFGALEYVNYFVVRLAYPIRLWLTTVGQRRAPRLVQDLRGAALEP